MTNKRFLILFMTMIICQLQTVNLKAADTDVIDDEELPAIDPFAGGFGTTSQVIETNTQVTQYKGLLLSLIHI